MTLVPTPAERLARARSDLRLGLPVVLMDETCKVLAAAAESLSSDRLAALRAVGPLSLVVTARRAETLRARAYDDDIARIVVPEDATIGWVASVADPKDDLSRPMKGPFETARGGDASLHRLAVRLTKSAHLLPAVLVAPLLDDPPSGLTTLHSSDVSALLNDPAVHREIVSGRVPLSVAERGRVHVFRPTDGGEEHVVCEIGAPSRDRPVLARLHSACFTGDVLGSVKCDCGPQLHAALDRIAEEGAGVLLYLNQEGRGIGLANKMRAYSLQDQGFDTVDANHRLGFEDDERDFRIGADLLKRLGFSSVRLMTNNPAKVRMMEGAGIAVTERVPLRVGRTAENTEYLDVKRDRSGHLL